MSIKSNTDTLLSSREEQKNKTAFKRLEMLFDNGVFTEIDAFAGSDSGIAEVKAAHGYVGGAGVYAFAQDCDTDGGAMSAIQAKKIGKIYDLALKTGEPVVAMYDSIGGRLNEGNSLLAAYGDILKFSNQLSGVVPQIALVLGPCAGTQALIASAADIVIMSEKAVFSLSASGEDSSSEYNEKHGTAHITASDDKEAIEKAKVLIELLPSNNLSPACVAYDTIDAQGVPAENASAAESAFAVADEGSAVELQAEFGKAVRTILATINGTTVGLIASCEKTIDGKAASKAARFIRFCDAFSMPVISFIDAEKFGCIKCAAKLTSAYSEATTAKISVITGDAFGAVYIAAAGTGASCDMTFAYPHACIGALTPEAETVIMLGDDFGGKLRGSKDPKSDRARIVEEYKKENMTAIKAASDGYVDDIITPGELRERLIAATDMLSGKRVATLPKKHNNLYI